jgi:hypothetical protein
LGIAVADFHFPSQATAIWQKSLNAVGTGPKVVDIQVSRSWHRRTDGSALNRSVHVGNRYRHYRLLAAAQV